MTTGAMTEQHAPGLSVDWLNAWLAAIGICVLVPEVRLRWSDDPVPHACFSIPDHLGPLAEVVGERLPDEGAMGKLAIARELEGHRDLARKVSLQDYRDRAGLARHSGDTTLSATVTDLSSDPKRADDLPHSPFDPAVPKGLTLWQRALACRQAVSGPARQVEASLQGRADRVPANGLGFDARRLVGAVVDADKTVDPVVELLAFQALALFPWRGRPRTGRDNGPDRFEQRARAWTDRPTQPGAFRWCAWSPSLDRWAVDALLDALPTGRSARDTALARRLGVTAWYHSVAYKAMSTSDATRAYAGERET